MDDLTHLAVEVAQEAGASYADARFVRLHDENVEVKNGAVTGLSSSR
jgi:predicted Zn-dependent protease